MKETTQNLSKYFREWLIPYLQNANYNDPEALKEIQRQLAKAIILIRQAQHGGEA